MLAPTSAGSMVTLICPSPNCPAIDWIRLAASASAGMPEASADAKAERDDHDADLGEGEAAERCPHLLRTSRQARQEAGPVAPRERDDGCHGRAAARMGERGRSRQRQRAKGEKGQDGDATNQRQGMRAHSAMTAVQR